jgi:hypothetical protein
MTDLPDFKIKALVSFPSNALGGTGIDITKSDGHFIVDLDYSEIAQVTTTADLATSFVVLWDEVTGVYQRISLADLKITLGIP